MTRRIHQKTLARTPVPGGQRIALEFRAQGDSIPAILQLPDSTPAPTALLIHGLTSRKETMADSLGAALLQQGIASLAIDLPLHGERFEGESPRSLRGAMELVKHWRAARKDCALAVNYMAARPEVDAGCLAVVGYSLGSYLGLALASDEPRIRAVILAAGGDLPTGISFESLARSVIDPPKLARSIAGTPLLMVHGRGDRTVLPEQAERLFAAAQEPKELVWYDAGHVLPRAAGDYAATWLKSRLR